MPRKTDLPVNNLCYRCAKKCKQTPDIKLIKCPHYEPMEVQTEIRLGVRRTRKKQV